MQCAAFVRWIEATVARLPPRGYEQAYGIWSGEDYLPVLEKELGLTECSIAFYEVSIWYTAIHVCTLHAKLSCDIKHHVTII